MKTSNKLVRRLLHDQERLATDNYCRARLAFMGMTEEQMEQEYLQSGMTRREVLRDYGKQLRRVRRALEE